MIANTHPNLEVKSSFNSCNEVRMKEKSEREREREREIGERGGGGGRGGGEHKQ